MDELREAWRAVLADVRREMEVRMDEERDLYQCAPVVVVDAEFWGRFERMMQEWAAPRDEDPLDDPSLPEQIRYRQIDNPDTPGRTVA